LRAASIKAGVTVLGAGAAALSGCAKTVPTASAVDVASRSRRDSFRCDNFRCDNS